MAIHHPVALAEFSNWPAGRRLWHYFQEEYYVKERNKRYKKDMDEILPRPRAIYVLAKNWPTSAVIMVWCGPPALTGTALGKCSTNTVHTEIAELLSAAHSKKLYERVVNAAFPSTSPDDVIAYCFSLLYAGYLFLKKKKKTGDLVGWPISAFKSIPPINIIPDFTAR